MSLAPSLSKASVCVKGASYPKNNPTHSSLSLSLSVSRDLSLSQLAIFTHLFLLLSRHVLTLAPVWTSSHPSDPFTHVFPSLLNCFSFSLVLLFTHTYTSSLISERFSWPWLERSSLAPWLSPWALLARWWWPSWSSRPPLWRSGTPKPSSQTRRSDRLTANKKGEKSPSSALISIRHHHNTSVDIKHLPPILPRWETGPPRRQQIWGVLRCWSREATVCPSPTSSGSHNQPSSRHPAPLPLWRWLSPASCDTVAERSGGARACPWIPAGRKEEGRTPGGRPMPKHLERNFPSFAWGGETNKEVINWEQKLDLGRHLWGKGRRDWNVDW